MKCTHIHNLRKNVHRTLFLSTYFHGSILRCCDFDGKILSFSILNVVWQSRNSSISKNVLANFMCVCFAMIDFDIFQSLLFSFDSFCHLVICMLDVSVFRLSSIFPLRIFSAINSFYVNFSIRHWLTSYIYTHQLTRPHCDDTKFVWMVSVLADVEMLNGFFVCVCLLPLPDLFNFESYTLLLFR